MISVAKRMPNPRAMAIGLIERIRINESLQH